MGKSKPCTLLHGWSLTAWDQGSGGQWSTVICVCGRERVRPVAAVGLTGFGLMLCAATGATSTAIYFLLTKSDVIIDKRNNPTPWENIDPTKPQKLRTISQEWRPLEELEMLKKYK
uniref:Normal mucosa of esophagus-specific gene 1 protein n=1 Tax=Callorhinchus milii TaxID=7868 RepID=A0A4W3KG78_CALMI